MKPRFDIAVSGLLAPLLVALLTIGTARAEGMHLPSTESGTIPPGTTITTANWQQYRQFMPAGMIAFFEGKYYWKMPPDVALEVGPTVIHPLPKNYLAATEKYSAQIRLVDLPDGGLTLQGYQGGIPFPEPAEPHQAWKIMANLWFHYIPHLVVDTYGAGCGINEMGGRNCFAYQVVNNQLSFNTDPGVAAEIAGAAGKFYTLWFMFLEPEEDRYTASLQIDFTDLSKPEEAYIYLPALRRAQPIAISARCSPQGGTDTTWDDFRYGFDSNLTELNARFLGAKKMLALLDINQPSGKFPADFETPLMWPKPSWGRWQVRDVDVISVAKIPARAKGYCYGQRVMYVDRAFWGLLWQELYDVHMKPWRYFAAFPRTIDVPGIGPVNSSGSDVEVFWDVQNNHLTVTSDPAEGRAYYVNQQAPGEYNDMERYTTAGGLNMVMR